MTGILRGIVGEYRRIVMTRNSALYNSRIFVPKGVPLSMGHLVYYDHQDKVKRHNSTHRIYEKCRRKHCAALGWNWFLRKPKKEGV